MPYDRSGTWVPTADTRQRDCSCPGCLHFQRLHGVTPLERWLSELVDPVYGENGSDQYGFDVNGLTIDGFNRAGRDWEGFNRLGFNDSGYDREGYDRHGFNVRGQDREGYNQDGFDQEERDREGYDYDGYDRDGWNRQGFNRGGFDRLGFNGRGFDREGFNRNGYDTEGYNRAGFNRAGQERPCDCTPCLVERELMPPMTRVTVDDVEPVVDFDPFESRGGWLNSYSYTPNPLIFRRAHGEDKRKTPYYGMEIEMTSDLTEQERVLGNQIGMENELLYFKHDGSVAGFEMVTHPMTARWARENFPWDVVEVMAAAGASVQPECNGLHIHVSRDGFRDEAHLYRWIKFWYKNQERIIHLAGRNGGNWGSFNEEQRILHARHAKAAARIRHNYLSGTYLRSADTGPRYCAINLQNEKTVEVRLFSATVSASMLRTRFELTAASVEYTRDLPVSKITKGGWKWDSFLLWLDEHVTDYSALSAYENERIIAAIERRNQAHEPALSLA